MREAAHYADTMSRTEPFEYAVDIAWGHCDPAGIIYYPNYYRWFDAAFHAFLADKGYDQRKLGTELGTFGTGLIEASAKFRAPVTYGDKLVLKVKLAEWSRKTVRIDYLGTSNGQEIVEGYEVRGLFMSDPKTGRLFAAPIEPLRRLIE